MCKNIKVINLNNKNKIFKSYKECLKNKKSTIFVEYSGVFTRYYFSSIIFLFNLILSISFMEFKASIPNLFLILF